MLSVKKPSCRIQSAKRQPRKWAILADIKCEMMQTMAIMTWDEIHIGHFKYKDVMVKAMSQVYGLLAVTSTWHVL